MVFKLVCVRFVHSNIARRVRSRAFACVAHALDERQRLSSWICSAAARGCRKTVN